MSATTAGSRPSPYIVGPLYDWTLFLLPPMLALAIGMGISGTAFADAPIAFWGHESTLSAVLIGIFINAHLVIVFFRSHGNREIFARHRFHFVVVPVLLYAGMLASPWILVSLSVLATFWDVYHSSLQTFGFARIYDARLGNDPRAGRRLDYLLNLLLYAGPILGGVTMIDHFEDFEEFEEVGATFFTRIPAAMEGHHAWLTWGVLGAGTLFLAYYLFASWRLHRRGYRVSPLKAWLLASTGFCSIYTWGFNTWGEAFFIMNFFHALQYFGIVWAFEKRTVKRVFGVGEGRLGVAVALLLFLGVACGYGYAVEALDTDVTGWYALTLVVSLLHFWYDGFIWSVRRSEV